MERRKKIEAEFQLPEPIIQHIQSFLTGKQAAQTSILSKAWYGAWLTRPNIDFDEQEVRNRSDEDAKSKITDGFSEFTKKTLQRYQDSNLNIESFRLWMNWLERDSYSLAKELLVKAVKMGVSDLNFEHSPRTSSFVLPHEVLGSETLIRLSVNGCRIGRGVDGKVNCSKLKSLILRDVHIEGDMIWYILSSCPLIENLLLSECKSFSIEVHNIYYARTKNRMLALSPFIDVGEKNVGSVVDRAINLFELHKLKCLFLDKVKIGTLFFSDFSSKFPCLKDLTIHYCFGFKEIKIYSTSLECISFAQNMILKANFDVPSLRKFSFSGLCLPSLSFETASREWESDISITWKHHSSSWFHKLSKLVSALSQSKISLSLNVGFIFEKRFDYIRDVECLPKPVVENLTVQAPSSVFCALLDGLFWSCRPKFITQNWLPKSCMGLDGKANNDLLEFLCKTLVREGSQNCYIRTQLRFALRDLEEVTVQLFEDSLAEWQPLPWKTLLDASACPENGRKVRFHLRWSLKPSTFKCRPSDVFGINYVF